MRQNERHARSRVVLFIVLSAFLVLSIVINVYLVVGLRSVSNVSITAAQSLSGLQFTQSEKQMMEPDLRDLTADYRTLRNIDIPNAIAPAVGFDPLPPGTDLPALHDQFRLVPRTTVHRPVNLEAVAFWSLLDLAELIRTRQVTSEELCRMYLSRLKRYGDSLHCVITLTEERALASAQKADQEIRSGHYRGPLHGLPYGAKDLLAVKGYPTTWGANPYRDQVIDEDATVIQKLDAAGAVLVAKLSMGALAMDDVWFGGQTRNPWNLKQGSSGSSAGSASATAAGLVAFSIGTETWGSIVSPSTRCRVTGLRPTFGRVSRAGAMALSWSMDKIGPICREVEDCAVVLRAIQGADGLDRSVRDLPLDYDGQADIRSWRVGFLKAEMGADSTHADRYREVLEVLSKAGAELVPFAWPEAPVDHLAFILNAEASAAFDDLTRSGRDAEMVRQGRNDWPNIFRTSRFIPAVEYLQANRARAQIMVQVHQALQNVDVVVAPSFGGSTLLLTNLTGHPAVVVPSGLDAEGEPVSLTFIGRLYEDGKALAVARLYQSQTAYHRIHPPLN